MPLLLDYFDPSLNRALDFRTSQTVAHCRRFLAEFLWHASIFLRLYTKLLGIKWELRGVEEIERVQACVVVVNHQSILDILGLFNIWTTLGNLAAVSKKALLWVIPFGPIAWLAGTVFIDRKNGKESMKTLVNVANKSQSHATKLLIFPEGTRNKDILSNGIQPFKKGAFKIAIDNRLPILPLVFSPYYFIDEKTYFFGHGKVIIKALEPISTEDLVSDDVDQLMANTHAIMQKEFQSLTKEIVSTLDDNYSSNVRWRQEILKNNKS
ncbi:putative 1-acyl-sn-glycerol-3-phosphate acyltransferase acl-2 isoform X2 [Fopius arisanus]|uniref:1-acyl-sn-glycerol-3-phosphate acyltransferase n=1 Tax=Fopius arisanus TaxID=64838 RepID=A0A9R1TCR4_9HYME|nr:PREDICTED: putative 1-acyl-sn-glycerol-3-phosphate acyltransferase acl-2 isoform X2 [Fopius arisanus]